MDDLVKFAIKKISTKSRNPVSTKNRIPENEVLLPKNIFLIEPNVFILRDHSCMTTIRVANNISIERTSLLIDIPRRLEKRTYFCGIAIDVDMRLLESLKW